MIILKLFTPRWIIPTLCVVAGTVLLVYLGLWQLDRQDQRRVYNQMVAERWQMEPLVLDAADTSIDLSELEFRRVAVSGEFDYENQIALKNQMWQEQAGIQLVTPLRIGENKAVLVARGWIPYTEAAPEKWAEYNEPMQATLIGRAHESQMMPSGEAPAIPSQPQQEWFRINIDAIQPQMPYELLPFFLYQLPEEGRTYGELPIRQNLNPLLELRDPVMHLSYAVQWFSFALVLIFGYIQLVRLQERRRARKQLDSTSAESEAPIDGAPEPTNVVANSEPLEHRQT